MPTLFAMISMPGPWELMLILVIVLILFGAGKLPQVFESFGKGIKAFKDAQKDDAIDVTPRTAKNLTDNGEELQVKASEPERATR